MPGFPSPMSLRERNRRAAMRTIQEVAVRRFMRDGFDGATIEEIATDAGVSPSTVYRYFGVKEELVLWDERDAAIVEALLGALDALAPLAALEEAFVAAYALQKDELDALRARAALIDATPALLAHQISRLYRDRVELVALIGRVRGKRARSLEIELAVRIALTALLAAFERWQASKGRKSLASWIRETFAAARSSALADGAGCG